MKIIRFDQTDAFSEVVVVGSWVHLSGQVALDKRGAPFIEQADEVLTRIDDLLKKADTDREHLVTAFVYLKSAEDLTAFNERWVAWFNGEPTPARTTVVCALTHPDFALEITVSAVRHNETQS